MFRRLMFLTGVIAVLSGPALRGQGLTSKLIPSKPASGSCSLIGEVRGRNEFAQTFLLKRDDTGQIEIVPFSRWTEFFSVPAGLKPRRVREIEPTDIQPGDRLCIVLDPSEATSTMILLLEPHPRPKSPPQTLAAVRL